MAWEWWMLAATANAVMVFIYGAIAIEMVIAIVKGKQLRSNPLLTATAAIFVVCTLGHGVHLEHAVLAGGGYFGAEGLVVGEHVRARFSDPRLYLWDAFTALTAVYFYTLRSRLQIVYRGAALCEDMAKREAQALELHDNVVQGLVQAKLELDMGNREGGRRTLDHTLNASRRIITELLGKAETETALGPGDLRRGSAAGLSR